MKKNRLEAEFEARLKKDLSRYFNIMPTKVGGRHIITNQLIIPDIICSPNIMTKEYGFTNSFCIECKVLPPVRSRRKTLIEGFWQAFEQWRLTEYKDYKMNFALVATPESYTKLNDTELGPVIYERLRDFNRKNVGWLDMSKGYPRFWMSRITPYESNGVKYNPKSMWQPAKHLDLNQLKIRIGSKTVTL